MAEFRRLLRDATASGGVLSDRETKLLRENFRAREKLRQANELLEKEKAKAAPVPAGGLVLTKEEAESYAEFKKLNVPAKDVATRLAERETLAADKTRRDAETILDAVAEELGLNARAFKRLVVAEGLTVTVKTVKVKDEESGKMVEEQVPVVRVRGAKADAEPEELSTVLERDYAEDLDTLMMDTAATGDAGGREDAGTRTSTTRPARLAAREAVQEDVATGGTRFPRTGRLAPTGGRITRKQQDEIVASKAATGRYAL